MKGIFGRTGLILALLVALGLAILAPSVTHAAKTKTPVGRVLVVSANLYETEEPDASNPRDMKNFVARILGELPYAPDVLLLQEVRHKSVEAVRSEISKKTGQRYAIATDAGDVPFREISESKVIGTDTAIVYNTTTMREEGKGGYIKTDYDHGVAAPGSKVKAKRHAYAQITERDGAGLHVALVSVHFPKQREFKSQSVSENVKKGWSKKIADFLQRKYSKNDSTHSKVIAGDFNNFRCSNRGGEGCDHSPLYKLLTGPFKYRDAVITIEGGAENPIDFVFAKGAIADAGHDDAYSPQNTDPAVFYSNHQFRWVLLGN